MSADIELTMEGSGELGTIWSGWNVSEGATPVNASESPNGSGAATFTALPTATSAFVVDNAATFTHEELGSFEGIITNVSDGSVVSGTISSKLSLLQADRNMPPTGNQPLSEIISGYVGAVTDQLSVSYLASSDPLKVYGGWSGEVWYYLNQLCSVNRLELSLSGSTIIVRDIGSTELEIEEKSDKSPVRTPNTQATGRTVEIKYYNPVLVASLGSTKYNYSQNPSLETNATGWAVALDATLGGAGGSITSSGRFTGAGFSGTACFRARMTGAVTASGGGLYRHTTVAIFANTFDVSTIADGAEVSASMYTFSPITVSGTAAISVDWLDASNAVIGNVGATTFTAPISVWTRATVEGLSKPIGAVTARINLRVRHQNANLSSSPMTNQDIYVDAALFTNGAIVPYFDGNTPGASWTGTTNNSASLVPISTENDFYNAYIDNNTIYSVSAGETVKTVVQTTNYPTYLAQPFQTNVFPNVVGSYYVSASDNLPVPSAEWAAYGGKVEVAIGEIPGTIEITLTAPSVEIPGVPSPYSLAVSDGSNSYAALSIAGIGVVTAPSLLVLGTGADPVKTTVEVAASLDSPFVDTLNQAYTTGAWMQLDATGSVGLSTSLGTHEIAGFGQCIGSVTPYKNSIYRHITLNIGATQTGITSKSFVTAGDADAVWAGKTAGQRDTVWSGYSAGDIHIEPLKVS